MGAAAAVLVLFGLSGPTIDQEIVRERPQLVPSGITTRWIADSAVAAAHPTHVATGAYRIDTACEGTFCVEELRIGTHVAIGAAAELASLRRAVADPDHLDETDATEVVLPRPSADGFLSVSTFESSYTEGAAHANSGGDCRTFRIATGRQVTLADALGARAARRVVRAARAWVADHPGSPAAWYRAAMTSFLLPAANVVVLCEDPDAVIHDDGTPRVVPVQVR